MARKLMVEIVGDASSLRRAVGQADRSSSKLGRTFGGLAKGGALAAGAAGVGALIYTLKTGIGEFKDSQRVAAQTNAVIKSTGGVAKVSAKQVDELATSLMEKSGVDDEAIASGENLLLTFTNIRNEAGKGKKIFDEATKATLDLSVAMGKDMQSSAVLVGKALNDPIKGLTALTRVGVSFTDGQKEAIKKMVEMGDTAGAQKLILKELNKEFGGSAEAAGKTLPGQIEILKQRFNNFSGELVAKTIPVLQQMIGWLRDHWPEIRAKVEEMWASVQPALVSFGELVTTVAGLIEKHWGTIGPIIQAVANIFKAQMAVITGILKVFIALLKGDWSAAWQAMKQVVSNVINGITGILNLAKVSLGALAKGIGVAIKNGVVDGVTGVASATWDVISNIGGYISARLGQAVGWGRSLGASILNGIKAALVGIGQWVVDNVRAAINSLIGRVNSLLEFKIAIPKAPDINVNAPDIPYLAAGGIVRRPTLAVVGERGPEAVVPLSRGAGRPMQVNLQVDGRTLAALLVDPFRNEVKQLQARGGTL